MMPFIGGDSALGMVRNYRTCWLGGRYGGGKTLLAHAIAEHFLRKKWARYLVSNVPSVWRDDPAKVFLRDGKLADAVVILDEAGIFLETGRDARKFLAYLRKMNITLLMPSVLEPSKAVQSLHFQRTMTYTPVGIPLWWYRANLRYGSQKESYSFGLWQPSRYFGIYDTEAAPDDDGGLDEYMKLWTQELQNATKTKVSYKAAAALRQENRQPILSPDEIAALSSAFDGRSSEVWGRPIQSELSALGDGGRQADVALEAAGRMEEAVSLLEQINRKRKN